MGLIADADRVQQSGRALHESTWDGSAHRDGAHGGAVAGRRLNLGLKVVFMIVVMQAGVLVLAMAANAALAALAGIRPPDHSRETIYPVGPAYVTRSANPARFVDETRWSLLPLGLRPAIFGTLNPRVLMK